MLLFTKWYRYTDWALKRLKHRTWIPIFLDYYWIDQYFILCAELRTCRPGTFQCTSGHCIPEALKCDGFADCLDYSDESTCRECAGLEIYGCLKSSYCIYWKSWYYSVPFVFPTATRYPGGRWCPSNQFQCDNKLCVNQQWVCDGFNDCGDRSDEQLNLCCKTLWENEIIIFYR